ncbi:hypothetical protein CUZ91_2224 [Enterococcus xinjiangensis]|nr:hypothetical protein [Enterococcus lactis]MBL5001160.1 hypothetical protein [Enterococcus lactis]
MNFSLFLGVASASAVYMCLERETKVKNTFVSRFFCFICFYFRT